MSGKYWKMDTFARNPQNIQILDIAQSKPQQKRPPPLFRPLGETKVFYAVCEKMIMACTLL